MFVKDRKRDVWGRISGGGEDEDSGVVSSLARLVRPGVSAGNCDLPLPRQEVVHLD